jgi:hypothetical protein
MDTRESGAHEELLPSRYRTLALEAFRMAKISAGKLGQFLHLDIYETRKLLKSLALVQIES